MNKHKFIKKRDQKFFVVKGEKGQQLTEREVYDINQNKMPGLLHVNVQMKGNSFVLNYNVTGLVSMAELLKSPLNKISFARLIRGILDNYQLMQGAFYGMQNVFLDMEHVMVNPATQQVFFIYLPIQFLNNQVDLKEFLLSIIQYSTFDMMENNEYVAEYIRILNSDIAFSVSNVQMIEYLDRILSGGAKSYTCPRCDATILKDALFCPKCGVQISKVKDNSFGVYDPLKNTKVEEKASNEVTKECFKDQEVEETQGLRRSGEEEEELGTSILGNPTVIEKPREVFLIRVSSQERISIRCNSFSMGKSKNGNDYTIAGNSAVSRSHAEIKHIGRNYYIVDLNSTNKTYVNGSVIVPNTDVQIHNGDEVMLADEKFVFYTE